MQNLTVVFRNGLYEQCRASVLLIGLLVCTALFNTVRAEWTGAVEGGTVVRDAGNATSLRLVLRNDIRPLSHYIFAEWINEADAGNSFAVGYNPRYWFNDTYYAFGESKYRTNPFLGIDRELKLVSGVGSQVISEKSRGLFVEAGLGGRSIAFDNIDDTFNEALFLARLGFYQILADSFKLDLSVSGSRSSDEVSEADSEVGLSMRVPGGAVRAAYRSWYIRVGDADSLTEDDTSLSFNYGF